MDNLSNVSQNSLYFEKMVEHRFISDIMAYCWYKNNVTLEIIRAEIDCNGYDLIINYKNINRYIQLKTSEENSKTKEQKLNLSIIEKENPCIIWIIRNYDNIKMDFNYKYLFWGSNIGKPLPKIENYSIAKHPKGNSKGVKNLRHNIRNIPKRDFEVFSNIELLFNKLFSKNVSSNLESIGYNQYTIPNSVDISELRKITKEHINKIIIRKNEEKDMEILCNMDKNDLLGKYFDKLGNIYYKTGKQINRFTLCINSLRKLYE